MKILFLFQILQQLPGRKRDLQGALRAEPIENGQPWPIWMNSNNWPIVSLRDGPDTRSMIRYFEVEFAKALHSFADLVFGFAGRSLVQSIPGIGGAGENFSRQAAEDPLTALNDSWIAETRRLQCENFAFGWVEPDRFKVRVLGRAITFTENDVLGADIAPFHCRRRN